MGLMDSLLGNASETDPSEANVKFAQLMSSGERVEKSYQLFRDSFLFTDKRLILVDVQGVTGSKIEYHSVPYRSITHFSVETSGTFDMDAELKIHITGGGLLAKKFNKKLNIYQVQSVLARYVLR